MNKKLLYVIDGFNPLYKDGVSNRVKSFCNCFNQAEYRVTVVALPSIKQYFKIIGNKSKLDSDVRWIIIPSLSTPNHIYFDKVIALILKLILLFIGIIIRPKFVLADSANTICLCKYLNLLSKVIGNYRGDTIDESQQRLQCASNDKRIMYQIEKLKESTRILNYSICVSRNLELLIEKQTGGVLKNNFIFPCCANIERFKNVHCVQNSDIVLGYFGGLNDWQCIPQVIKFVIELRKLDPRYRFLLITQSDYKKYEYLLSELGKENYTVISAEQNQIPNLIAKMDISFAIRTNRNLNIVSSPTKISDSLAAGVPVIVTQFTGDYKETIDGNTGCVLKDENVTDINIKKIHRFCLQVKNNRDYYFDTCRIKVSKRTWNFYAKQFISFIEK